MDREAFFSRKAQTTEVTLDDGQSVHARKLNQSEVETLQRKYRAEDKALEGLRFIVARCVVDDAGKRVFGDDDTSKLTEVDYQTISTIAEAVMSFSGLKTDAKNV